MQNLAKNSNSLKFDIPIKTSLENNNNYNNNNNNNNIHNYKAAQEDINWLRFNGKYILI